MSNNYWSGTQQAQLDRSQITAHWGAGGVSFSTRSINFVNRAFEIYYQAHQNINACPDTEHSTLMLRQLQEAGRSGYSILGEQPDDLEEAFQHLVNNSGTWTNDETRSYFGGREKVFNASIVTAPVSIVSFMNAVDSKMATLHQALENFNTQAQNLQRAQQSSDWGRVGTILGEINTWGGRAKPFLWTAPALERHAGTAVSYVGALSNIHSGMTTYVQAQRAGFPQGTAAAIGAMRTAVGWVPVLGSFYGKAIDMIPGLVTWFQGIIDNRVRQLDAASRHR